MFLAEHLDDVASDFSAIHGIADVTLLRPEVFWRMAWRLAHYPGVMHNVVTALAASLDDDGEDPAMAAPGVRGPGAAGRPDVTMVPATRAALEATPEFAGIFSFGNAGGGARLMDGFKIATAFVEVSPELDGFEEKLKAKLEDLHADAHIGLDDGDTNARLDEIEGKLEAIDHTEARPKVDSSSVQDAGGWIGLLVAGITAVAPVAITAGMGLAAFGALAIPTIKKVIDYQTLLGQHTAASAKQAKAMWDGMDAGQRQLVTGLHALAGTYTEVASAVEPQVITDFNVAVRQADGILPELTSSAEAGGRALGGFFRQFGGFMQGGVGRQFFDFITDQAGPDMQAFGNLLDGLLSGIFGLTEALNPLAKVLVNDLAGLANFIGDLARGAPWLVQWGVGGALAAMAVGKLAAGWRALTEMDAVQWLVKTTSAARDAAVATAGAQAATVAAGAAAVEAGAAEGVFAVGMDGVAVSTTAAAAAMADATAAEVAMSAAGAVLSAVNPLVWVGAAIGGIVLLGHELNKNKSYVDQLNEKFGEQQKAAGYSIGKLYDLDNAYEKAATGAKAAADPFNKVTADIANREHLAQIQYLNQNLNQLGATFGLTRHQTVLAAVAAGVQASAFEGSAKSAQDAREKVAAYLEAGATASGVQTELAVETSILGNSFSTAAQKVTALQNAFNNLVSPQLDLMNSTVAFKQAQLTLATALQKSHDRLGEHTTAERDATTATTGAVSAAFQNSSAIEKATGSNQKAIVPLQRLADQLEKAGLKGAGAAKLIAELRRQIAALKSKKVNVDVVFGRSGPGAGGPDPSNQSLPGQLPSGFGAAKGTVIPGYAPGKDTEPYMLSKGEGVLVPEAVRGLGAGFVHAANKYFGGSRIGGGNQPGRMAEGGIAASARFGFPQDVFNITVDEHATQQVLAGLGSSSKQTAAQSRRSAAEQRIKTFEDTGRKLADAFANGSLKTLAQIKAEAGQAIAAIQQYYSGHAQTKLVDAIRRQTSALEELSKRSAAIQAKIAAEKSYASSINSSLQGYSALSGLTAPTAGETPGALGTSIKTQLAAKLASLHQFFTLLGKLKSAGVDKSMIAQVVALGPDAGIQYAEAILSGGSALISELNSEEKQINKYDTKIADRATEIQYGQSITKGFLSSLKSRREEIKKEMRGLGDEIARELAKDFGVSLKDLPKGARQPAKKHHAAHHDDRPVHLVVNFNGTQRPNGQEMAAIKRELALAVGG